MPATTIDEVITRLDAIVQQSIRNQSRLGYFAALYKRVTIAVREHIREKFFDDNARMERLDVVFANRYLDALDSYENGKPCSGSWKLAFDAAKTKQPLVIQHLFAGMNAHIGLDLGIAAATVCPGASINPLHNDFNKINTVLGNLVGTVQNELADIWPLLKPIDWIAGKLDEELASFSMEIARDAAWETALAYAPLTTPQQQQAFISARDTRVAAFSTRLLHPGVLLSSVIYLARLGETGTIAWKIAQLNT